MKQSAHPHAPTAAKAVETCDTKRTDNTRNTRREAAQPRGLSPAGAGLPDAASHTLTTATQQANKQPHHSVKQHMTEETSRDPKGGSRWAQS